MQTCDGYLRVRIARGGHGCGLNSPKRHEHGHADAVRRRCEVLTDTALTLYEKPDVKPGDSSTWKDEATGTAGTMVVTDATRDPKLCVSVQHIAKPAAQKDLVVFLIRRCRADNGEWLVSL